MKPSELAKALESEDADVAVMKDHFAVILLALRHHEALVDLLKEHGQLWDQLGYPFPSALAARKLLAQIEREGA